jgi:hypothetical protein
MILSFLQLCRPCKVQPKFVDPRQADYLAAVGERVDMNFSVHPNVYPTASVA